MGSECLNFVFFLRSRAWQLCPGGIYLGESGTLELWRAYSMAFVNNRRRTCRLYLSDLIAVATEGC